MQICISALSEFQILTHLSGRNWNNIKSVSGWVLINQGVHSHEDFNYSAWNCTTGKSRRWKVYMAFWIIQAVFEDATFPVFTSSDKNPTKLNPGGSSRIWDINI